VRRIGGALLACVLAACYGEPDATRDVNAAYRGRSRAAIEARFGTPTRVEGEGGTVFLRWIHEHRGVGLPSGHASLEVGPGSFDFEAAIEPGAVWTSTTELVARVDGDVVTEVQGPSLRWAGPPSSLNARWGLILGVHAGMGRLDDTSTWLPGGGGYIGGMLGPRLGLVGTFELASGSDDDGGAMLLAPGLAAQWWPLARVSLRAGPAMVIAWDPGFENGGLGVGLNAAAAYALVRSGSFVLDLRIDLIGSTNGGSGVVGIGVAEQ
jgi:hypothetical protein